MVIFGGLGPGTLDLGDSIVTYWVAGISHHKSASEPGRKKMNWGKHGLTPPCFFWEKKSVFESRGASCLFLQQAGLSELVA